MAVIDTKTVNCC